MQKVKDMEQKAVHMAKKALGKEDTATEHASVSSSHGGAPVSSSHQPTAGMPGAVAVGLPDVGTETKTATYTDTTVRDTERAAPVSEVVDRVETGQGIETTKETVTVPRTEMRTETIEVPETRIEKTREQMPVTVTRMLPSKQKEVVMKDEQVRREEVVLDKRTVDKPTTVLKPVTSEVPRLYEHKVMLPRPHEVMKKVKVVHPENVVEEVEVQTPKTRSRMVKIQRPVTRTKRVTIQKPVPFTTPVNITIPEIREGEMDIQVPVSEEQSVEYAEPVTVIRSAERDALASAGEAEGVEAATGDDVANLNRKERNWQEIPVGLPFTEMVERAQNFTVTHLAEDTQHYRETWMQPVQVQRQEYKMESVEVDITETVMEEFEEEITETFLEKTRVPMTVTIMNEVEEEWPVIKERAEEVWCSEVTLEPRARTVPEVALQPVQEEVPRTVEKVETVQTPETVEREVMVEQARIENQEVEVEKPVQDVKQVQVERPHVVEDTVEVDVARATEKPIHTQEVREQMQTVPAQEVTHETKTVPYEQARTQMTPAAVEGNVKVEGDVAHAAVHAKDLPSEAANRTSHLEEQPGVAVGAHIHSHTLPPTAGSEELGLGASEVTPAAQLPPGTTSATTRDPHTGVDGHLVDPTYQESLQDMIGKPTLPGQSMPSANTEDVTSSRWSASRPGETGTFKDQDAHVPRHTQHPVEYADPHLTANVRVDDHTKSGTDDESKQGTKEKIKGFLNKIM